MFERFLLGDSLEECYDAVAEVANRWLDMLDTQASMIRHLLSMTQTHMTHLLCDALCSHLLIAQTCRSSEVTDMTQLLPHFHVWLLECVTANKSIQQHITHS